MASIEEREGDRWRDPADGESPLVRRCLGLRRKELAEFTVEDLRVMLGQRIAVPILLPMAVEILLATPLAEGDFYPGDLLHAVVTLAVEDWGEHIADRRRLAEVLTPLIEADMLRDHLRPAVLAFAA